MSVSKRKRGQDSDDDETEQNERLQGAEGNAPGEDVCETVRKIVNQHFGTEEAKRTKQLFEIQTTLNTAQETLNDLRHAVIAQHYHRPEVLHPQPVNEPPVQTRIHPAVKKLLNVTYAARDLPRVRRQRWKRGSNASEERSPATVGNTEAKLYTKVPRYVPPTAKPIDSCNEGRRAGVKTLKRLLVGNVSRWLPLEAREDNASHKWMLYVRFLDEENPGRHIAKVRFLLHPSYKPHDVVDVRLPPFHLSRRGWGEFQARVQVYFHNSADKPLDIRHDLKLDRTYTGLETLGSETHVNVWLHVEPSPGDGPSTEPEADATITSEDGANISSSITSEDTSAQFTVPDDGDSLECSSVSTSDTSWIKMEEPEVSAEQNNTLDEIFLADVELDDSSVEIKEEVVETCEETFEMPEEEEPQPAVEEDIVAPDAETIPQKMMKIRFLRPDGKALYFAVDPKNVRRTNPKLSRCTIARAYDRNPTRRQIAAMTKTGGMLNQNGFKIAHVQTQQGVVSKLVPISGDEKIQRKTNSTIKVLTPVSSESLQTTKVLSKLSTVSTVKPLVPSTVNQQTLTSSKPIIMLAPLISMSPTQTKNSMQQVSVLTNTGRPGIQIVPNMRLVSPVRPQTTIAKPSPTLPTIRLITPARPLAQNMPVKQLPTLKLSSPPVRFISQPNSNVKHSATSQTPVRLPTTSIKPGSLLLNQVRVPNPGLTNTVLSQSSTSKEPSKNLLILKNGQYFIRPANLVSQQASVKTISILNKTQRGGVSLLKPKSILRTSVLPASVDSTLVIKSEQPSESSGDIGKVIQEVEAADGSVHVLYRPVKQERVSIAEAWYTVQPLEKRGEVAPWASPEFTGRARYLDILSKLPLQYTAGNHDLTHAVTLALRHYPLVDAMAQDVQYRVVHPYCMASVEVFLQGRLGKRRSAEWVRAKTVHRRLLESGWPGVELWSTCQIMRFARRHGFTPARGVEAEVKVARSSQVTSYSEAAEVKAWLETVPSGDVNEDDSDNDVEVVDVVNVEVPVIRIKREHADDQPSAISMKPTHEEQTRCDFVRTTAAEIGVRLEPEEIEPGIEYPAAAVALVQALKSFADDLLRRALCKAWERNHDRPPESVTLRDVRAAIMERPEFDMLTNSGLGIQPIDKG